MKRYDQNIILDLEFAPVDKNYATRAFRNEIIQIGALRIDTDGIILDSFLSFVKPVNMKRIHPSVQKLSGIKTYEVSKKEPLENVLKSFRDWIGSDETRYITWSDTDLRQLKAETKQKHLTFPEADSRWLNLQKVYPRVMNVGNGRRMALRVAADWYGIKIYEDNLHGALYDARLTAELLSNLITGDYVTQKDFLSASISNRFDHETLTFSIGEKFSSLMKLKMDLEAAVA